MALLVLLGSAANAADATSADAADAARGGNSAGVILQYHHVAEDTPSLTSLSPQLFADHLDLIEQADMTVVGLDRLVQGMQSDDLPELAVAITFDDAFADIYDNAVPLLRERGWPFTIFVATEPVGRAGYMSWAQLSELHKEADALLANHSHGHGHLVRRPPEVAAARWWADVRADIERAQTLIERHTNERRRMFAYPYGEYSPTLQELVESLGFVGFGQQSGAVGPGLDPTLLPRFPMSGPYASLSSLREKLTTRALPILHMQRVGQAVPGPRVDPLLGHAEAPPLLRIELAETATDPRRLSCFASGQGRIEVRIEGRVAMVQAGSALPLGRSRYNCTLPTGEKSPLGGQRFHWFSQLWMRMDEQGELPAE